MSKPLDLLYACTTIADMTAAELDAFRALEQWLSQPAIAILEEDDTRAAAATVAAVALFVRELPRLRDLVSREKLGPLGPTDISRGDLTDWAYDFVHRVAQAKPVSTVYSFASTPTPPEKP